MVNHRYSIMITFILYLIYCVSSVQSQVSSTAKILSSVGYLAEDHYIQVQNNTYTLNLVKASNPLVNGSRHQKVPLLFVHGILLNANSFMLNNIGVSPKDYTEYDINSMSIDDIQELLNGDPASQSLVFSALNFGHEVWLLNRRSTLDTLESNQNMIIKSNQTTRESWNNIIRKNESDKFPKVATSTVANYWNYSLDEQALFDIPDTIDYVLSKTGQKKLTYIGHSAGSALMLMSLVIKPELADKISKALLWAPALYLKGDFVPPVRYFMYLSMPIYAKIIDPVPSPRLDLTLDSVIGSICTSRLTQLLICDPVIDYILGLGSTQSMVENLNFRNKFFTMISSHEGAQLIQSIETGKMHYFDYLDASQNKLAYGQSKPPLYDVAKIRLETLSLWSGVTDVVVPTKDVDRIINDLTVPAKHYIIRGPGVLFDHISYLIHNDVSKLLIIPCLKIIGTD